jgi:hypothetical protein
MTKPKDTPEVAPDQRKTKFETVASATASLQPILHITEQHGLPTPTELLESHFNPRTIQRIIKDPTKPDVAVFTYAAWDLAKQYRSQQGPNPSLSPADVHDSPFVSNLTHSEAISYNQLWSWLNVSEAALIGEVRTTPTAQRMRVAILCERAKHPRWEDLGDYGAHPIIAKYVQAIFTAEQQKYERPQLIVEQIVALAVQEHVYELNPALVAQTNTWAHEALPPDTFATLTDCAKVGLEVAAYRNIA